MTGKGVVPRRRAQRAIAVHDDRDMAGQAFRGGRFELRRRDVVSARVSNPILSGEKVGGVAK